MLTVIAVLTALSLVVCCGEAYDDRTWPRATFKYFAFFACCLAGWLLFVS